MVGSGVFRGCERLRSVSLPGWLEAISAGAFEGCALEELEIPASVAQIGECAFRGCGRLRRVSFGAGSVLQVLGDGCF